MYDVLIKSHQGKRKKYYTVHLLFNGQYIRIFGKYSNIQKAVNVAEDVARKYGVEKYKIE